MTLEQVKKLKVEIAERQRQMQEEIRGVFSASIKELFVKHPWLKSIQWTQYTPYFNDGDTCEFSSNAAGDYCDFGLNDENAWGDYDGDDAESARPSNYDEIRKDVRSFLGVFEDADYFALFGDHAVVTVTSEGATVEQYDHD